MENNLSKPDYYSVGSREDIVLSSSSFSYLDPEQGGSIQKFLSFFDKQVEKTSSKSLENGTVVHAYVEKPGQFTVAAIPKPDGMLGAMADEFYRLMRVIATQGTGLEVLSFGETIDVNITSDLKTEGGRSAEILDTRASYEKLGRLVGLETEVTIGLFRLARTGTNSYKSYKEKTLDFPEILIIRKMFNSFIIE